MKTRNRCVLSIALGSALLCAVPAEATKLGLTRSGEAPRTKSMQLEASFASGSKLGKLVARPDQVLIEKWKDGSYSLVGREGGGTLKLQFWYRRPMDGVQAQLILDLNMTLSYMAGGVDLILNRSPGHYNAPKDASYGKFFDQGLILDDDDLREGENVLIVKLKKGDRLRRASLRSEGLDVIFADKHMKPMTPPASHPDSLRLAEAEELMAKALQQAGSGLNGDALTSLSACVKICDGLVKSNCVEIQRQARALKQKAQFTVQALTVE